MAFMRIQVASGQDELAADAIIQSLTIDNSQNLRIERIE